MSHVHTRPGAGESPPFHFETTWRVAEAVEPVWEVLSAIDEWPRWWPGIAQTHALDGSVEEGSRADIVVRSPVGLTLTLRLRIERIDPPRQVVLDCDGDLRGRGVWTLDSSGPLTVIDAVWCVTTKRLLPRLVRPLSAGLHSAVMRSGERGLRSRLSALT
ncbi:SRPBCC family protein [Brevibacterium metallidurans]|uniref:SRPBCC family protein n=1 Tax=Brevibacterium metallidurans TaxID=1482676 RepID=A0ABN0SRF4_9MICO